MKADVTTLDAKKAGTIDLPDEIFGLEPRVDILQRMVRYQLLKRQAGTHHVKDRSLVSGRSEKMYKQKGTGRARHGNKMAPQFRGGGKAFGPVPRSHAIELPKKVRALALKHALSTKAKSKELIILDKAELPEAKTRALEAKFAALGFDFGLDYRLAANWIANSRSPRGTSRISTFSPSPASTFTTSCAGGRSF